MLPDPSEARLRAIFKKLGIAPDAFTDETSLRVQDYIGVSLFGRTEVWSRVK